MADEAKKREAVAKHEWIDAGGDVVKSIEDAVGTRYTLRATGNSIDMNYDDLPDAARVWVGLFGIRTLGTNASSSARNERDEGPDGQFVAVSEKWAALCDGEWGEGREGGVPVFLLAQATARATKEKGIDDERIKALKKWLRGLDAEARKAHAERPQIAAQVLQIRSERAAERAAAAAQAADAAGGMDVPV